MSSSAIYACRVRTAKDFSTTDRMVSAWMASPTHKANIVNDKFQDIGIAVVPGTLQGQDTVLVVQLFGTTSGASAGSLTATAPQVAEVQGAVADVEKPTVTPTPTPLPVPTIVQHEAEVLELKEFTPTPSRSTVFALDEFNIKKFVSLLTTALLILVLLADVVIAESKRLSRRVSKNWAHIMFINVILIVVTIVNAGSII